MRSDPPYPWQTALHQQWLQQLQRGCLAPALLLVGPPGSGMADLAAYWARVLLCENCAWGSRARTRANQLQHDYNKDENQLCLCGEDRCCPSCQLLQKQLTHPDCWLVDAVPTATHVPQASAAITVDRVRDFNNFWHYSASRGGYKVAIMDSAERLNIAATNALLKTVEELPPASCAMFITSYPSRLAATLRSRLVPLRLEIGVPQRQAMQQWLRQQSLPHNSMERHMQNDQPCDPSYDQQLQLAWRLFDAAPLTIRASLQQHKIWQQRQQLFSQLQQLLWAPPNRSPHDHYDQISELAQQLLQLMHWPQLTKMLQTLMQDLVKMKLHQAAWVVNLDQTTFLAAIAQQSCWTTLYDLERWWGQAVAEQRQFNLNSTLLIEQFLFKLLQLIDTH